MNLAQKSSGMGPDSLDDRESLLNEPQDAKAGTSVLKELPLTLIDEDLNQPRKENNPGFSVNSLEELAATIRDRGVKSPISVRVNHENEGRYIINHGARRYRASKLAGRKTIPAFIDNDYNEDDQIIENLHRDELTALEIAVFIERELAKGKKKSDIAKEIGKSPAFVKQHVTLLNLPEPIAAVFNSGRAKDVTAINELVKAYKDNPHEVTTWLSSDNDGYSRESVKTLRTFLENKHQEGEYKGNAKENKHQEGEYKGNAKENKHQEGEYKGNAKPGKQERGIDSPVAARNATKTLDSARVSQIRAEGEKALRRLFELVRQDSIEDAGKYVSRFLLGRYNDQRVLFDLNWFRSMNLETFDDCMAVLRMDYLSEHEI